MLKKVSIWQLTSNSQLIFAKVRSTRRYTYQTALYWSKETFRNDVLAWRSHYSWWSYAIRKVGGSGIQGHLLWLSL